jgi:hypothetical protein
MDDTWDPARDWLAKAKNDLAWEHSWQIHP